MKRALALLCVVLALAALVALALVGGGEEPPLAPSTPGALVVEAPPPPGPARLDPAPLPAQGDPADVEASLDRFLGAVPVTAADTGPAPGAILERAITAGEDPVTTGLALEESLRRDPTRALELARRLAALPDAADRWRLRTALALASRLDAAGTDELLARLRDAPAANRQYLVVALRGSAEPRADRAFADLYVRDADAAVRDAAAHALGERAERLDPAVRAPALARAREALRQDDPKAWSAAADVLGAPPLDPRDEELLADVLAHDREPERRLVALRALAGAGASIERLRPTLRQVVADPLAGEALRAAAQAALGPGG